MADGVGEARAEAEGELALARLALDDGDLSHAAAHLANALTEDPGLPGIYQGLDELASSTGDALALYPMDGRVYLGAVVARSYLAAREGDVNEALTLLIRAANHDPHKPWAAAGWLELPGLAERVDPGTVLPRLVALSGALPDPVPQEQRPGLMPFLDLGRSVFAAHPDAIGFKPLLSGLARRLGELDEAIAWCEEAERTDPTPNSAIMLGYALRSAGRLEDTERAWRSAIERDPDNLYVYVDLAETLANHGRLDEALRWLDRALERDPAHPKAFPAACAMRFEHDGDVTHLVRLADHLRANPDQEYADTMLARSCHGRPWLNLVPPPAEAVTNLVAQIVKQYPDAGRRQEMTGTGTVSALEPPSAMAAAATVLPGMSFEVTDVPTPDLRTPLRPVRHQLWRYTGTIASPLSPPPSAHAADALRTVAREPWEHPLAAYDRAVHLAGLPLEDLLGLLTHVPPTDDTTWDAHPEYWPRYAQGWACLGLLHFHADEPWPTSTRRAVLLDLATGVEDWTTDAALWAMSVAAWVSPELRSDVAHIVGRRFLDATQAARTREVTIRLPLAHLNLSTPAIIPEITALARDMIQD